MRQIPTYVEEINHDEDKTNIKNCRNSDFKKYI